MRSGVVVKFSARRLARLEDRLGPKASRAADERLVLLLSPEELGDVLKADVENDPVAIQRLFDLAAERYESLDDETRERVSRGSDMLIEDIAYERGWWPRPVSRRLRAAWRRG